MSWDPEYDQVIADYAAGHDVAEIERRYGLTRAEIEWLVAHSDDPPPSSPATPPAAMTRDHPRPSPSHRGAPPGPVVAVAAVLAIVTALLLAVGVLGVVIQAWVLPVMSVIFGGICGFTAHGLWQGLRGARISTIVVCSMIALSGWTTLPTSDTVLVPLVFMALGIAGIVLVSAPAASRAWFARTKE